MAMIPLLTFYIYAIYTVATFPNTDSRWSRNVTTESRNDACTGQRSINESLNMTSKKLRDPGVPTFHNMSSLPAFKRAKRDAIEEEKIDLFKEKAINLMEQAMYASQELIWKLEPHFQKYENDTNYRMAFIFLKLEQLMKDSRSIISYIAHMRDKYKKLVIQVVRPKQRLQVYWQLVRKNVDVTALVDYIIRRVPLGTEGNDSRRYLTGPRG